MPSSAYVPGFEFDIFVSYSHVTDEPTIDWNKGWVTSFSEDLKSLLKTKLGPDVSLWLDTKNLRKSANYNIEIESQVKSCAILLTINSDPYLSSVFSQREVRHFRESWAESIALETERPILQVYQSIGPSGRVPKIDPNRNGFFFCENPKRGLATTGDPFPQGSDDYKHALKSLAREIQGLLYELRRRRESIFIGPPEGGSASSFDRIFEDLSKELSHKYRVEVPAFSDMSSAIEKLAETKMSLHFLSPHWDEASKARIEVALQGTKPCAVFVAREIRDNPNHPLASFLSAIEGESRIRPKELLKIIHVVPGNSTISDYASIIDGLMPKTKPLFSGKSLIYFLNNPREDDRPHIKKVRTLLERVKWVRSEPYRNNPDSSRLSYHLRQLATCDGILLFWSENTTWFEENYGQLQNALGFRKAQDFRSRAICVLPPPPLPPGGDQATRLLGEKLVLQFSSDEDFRIRTLKPFLTPLKP